MICMCCGKALSGGLDTFGDVGAEMCFDCWLALLNEQPEEHVDIRELMDDEDDETVETLQQELEGVQAEIDELEERRDSLEARLWQLKDAAEKPMRDAKQALEKWQQLAG